MSTFYVGPRPVLRGRNVNEFSNPYRANAKGGVLGVYSYYAIFGPGLLTGEPDHNHTPGRGYHPHDLSLSRRFLGLDTQAPLDHPGLGARQADGRYGPFLYRGAGNDGVFALGLGHAAGRIRSFAEFNNNLFHGLPSAQVLSIALGHARRPIGTKGAPFSFGEFEPDAPHGLTQALANGGQALPPTHDSDPYGHNKVMEWFGVPSAKAL